MNVRAVGEYIRAQREKSALSLRKVSGLAGVSIPYLSQVERGLRRPSADILQAIAKALRISAETLYVQAGILEDRPTPDVVGAIMGDPAISEKQKQALVQIYEALRDEARVANPDGAPEVAATRRKAASAAKAAASSGSTGRPGGKAGGGAKSLAPSSPHPAPLRPSVTKPREEV
jgi:transcriptional regulator with XRE-family HTH domain